MRSQHTVMAWQLPVISTAAPQTKRQPIRNLAFALKCSCLSFASKNQFCINRSCVFWSVLCETSVRHGLRSSASNSSKSHFECDTQKRIHFSECLYISLYSQLFYCVCLFTLSLSVTNFFPPLASQWININFIRYFIAIFLHCQHFFFHDVGSQTMMMMINSEREKKV